MIKKFCLYGMEHWGSDSQGVEKCRYYLLNWMSFLHRYTPIGIVDEVPIKMNMRPPKYYGRDDLETKLSSPVIEDWIEISSMFLGPPPDNMHFEPKHKADSYRG